MPFVRIFFIVSDLTLLSLYLIGDNDLKDGQKISADANSDGSIDL